MKEIIILPNIQGRIRLSSPVFYTIFIRQPHPSFSCRVVFFCWFTTHHPYNSFSLCSPGWNRPVSQSLSPYVSHFFPPDCLRVLLPGPYLLSKSIFVFSSFSCFFLFFGPLRYIKLAVHRLPSALSRFLYRIIYWTWFNVALNTMRVTRVGCVAQWWNAGIWPANFPVLRSTCSWWVITYVGKPSATSQPTRQTQPFIFSGSIIE